MKTGKRYWLDKMKDVSGIYAGTDIKGNYIFCSLNNNYCYLNNQDGTVTMPKWNYERAPELVTIIYS